MPIHEGYHHRGYLPHLKVAGPAYFVTFRLADSLPRDAVVRLMEQRDHLLQRAAQEKPDDHDHTRRALFVWYAAEVDALLDRHSGAVWMRQPRVAALVAGALRHFEVERYALHAWCVMPNHVHVVVRPHSDHALDTILHSWKSYTGSEANKLLGRIGEPFWQAESYDHWIRGEEISRIAAATRRRIP